MPEDDHKTLALRRAAFGVLGNRDDMYREYTDAELRRSLKAVMSGTTNQAQAREKFGPAEKTQDSYAKVVGGHFGLSPPKIGKQIRDLFQSSEGNGLVVSQFIDTMPIGKPGNQAYLSAAERNVAYT